MLHFDETCEIEATDAETIRSSTECSNLSFRLKNRPVWGIQPHFEIGIVEGLAIIDRVREPGMPEKSMFLAEEPFYPRDSGVITRIAREFIKARPERFRSGS